MEPLTLSSFYEQNLIFYYKLFVIMMFGANLLIKNVYTDKKKLISLSLKFSLFTIFINFPSHQIWLKSMNENKIII